MSTTDIVMGAAAGVIAAMSAGWAMRFVRETRQLGTSADRATYKTLHTASMAAPSFREGLTAAGATRAARHLRSLLGTPAVAIVDLDGLLAWDGEADHHAHAAPEHARGVLESGRNTVISGRALRCPVSECPARNAIIAPITTEDRVVGAVLAYGPQAHASLVRATNEVAQWISTQVALADLDHSKTRAVEAELRALRAQISPHFVYNSLAAIASFVRTDPERARELLLDFADFTRYAFRRGGEFTSLSEEMRNIERYLVLEKARFGERLIVQLRVAPEVLPVAVPYLSVQPLVENAVRHGLEGKPSTGRVTILAEDLGAEAQISVEDDGVGTDPDQMGAILAGEGTGDSIGLSNVDARLRQVFGDACGLVVETAPGAGTKVSFKVPKFAPGVHASR